MQASLSLVLSLAGSTPRGPGRPSVKFCLPLPGVTDLTECFDDDIWDSSAIDFNNFSSQTYYQITPRHTLQLRIYNYPRHPRTSDTIPLLATATFDDSRIQRWIAVMLLCMRPSSLSSSSCTPLDSSALRPSNRAALLKLTCPTILQFALTARIS